MLTSSGTSCASIAKFAVVIVVWVMDGGALPFNDTFVQMPAWLTATSLPN